MPFTLIRRVVVITEDGADFGGPPLHTDAGMVTCLGVGSHSRTEALTVSSRVTGTCIKHTSVIVRSWVNRGVTIREDYTVNDATLFVGPWQSVWVGHARVGEIGHVGAAGRVLPAVPEHQRVYHQRTTPRHQVVVRNTVIVPTQSTNVALIFWAEFDEDDGLSVPDENEPYVGLDDQIHPHSGEVERSGRPDQLVVPLGQNQLRALCEDLNGLGACSSSGTTRDVLCHHPERPFTFAAVVLGQDILAVAIKGEEFLVKGSIVSISIHSTGSIAQYLGADPLPVFTCACVAVDFDALSRGIEDPILLTGAGLRFDAALVVV